MVNLVYPELYHDWFECTQDDFIEILEALGFDDVDTYFSGFWSQGDGASFSGTYQYKKGALKLVENLTSNQDVIELAKQLQELQRRNFYQLVASISLHGRYCHENTMNCHVERDCDQLREPTSNADDEFTDICRELAQIYYKRLETEYDYLFADACAGSALTTIRNAKDSLSDARDIKAQIKTLFCARNSINSDARPVLFKQIRQLHNNYNRALENVAENRATFHEWLKEYVSNHDGFKHRIFEGY